MSSLKNQQNKDLKESFNETHILKPTFNIKFYNKYNYNRRLKFFMLLYRGQYFRVFSFFNKTNLKIFIKTIFYVKHSYSGLESLSKFHYLLLLNILEQRLKVPRYLIKNIRSEAISLKLFSLYSQVYNYLLKFIDNPVIIRKYIKEYFFVVYQKYYLPNVLKRRNWLKQENRKRLAKKFDNKFLSTSKYYKTLKTFFGNAENQILLKSYALCLIDTVSSNNNIFVTVSNILKKNTIFYLSAGKVGLTKKKQKRGDVAWSRIANELGRRLNYHNCRRLCLLLKVNMRYYSYNLESFLNIVEKYNINFISINYVKNVPHNGLRGRKAKRR